MARRCPQTVPRAGVARDDFAYSPSLWIILGSLHFPVQRAIIAESFGAGVQQICVQIVEKP